MLWLADELKSNISEYILMLWQTEDLVRGLGFDTEKIEGFIYQMIDQGAEVNARRESARLIEFAQKMKAEGLQKGGHTSESKMLIENLDQLYVYFAREGNDEKFVELFGIAQPNIKEFKKKSGLESASDIEACFHALYAFLLLKLQKQKISPDTDAAMKSFSDLLAYLSVKFTEVSELN